MSKETSVKTPEENGGENQFNLDGILAELGSFGKYQLLLLFLLAFRDSFLSMCNYNYVFTAPNVRFRCHVPECEEFVESFNASWMLFALNNNSNECRRPNPRQLFNVSDLQTPWENCRPDRFLNTTVPCDHVVYESYNSIVAEFDLGCEPWKRTLIGTVHNLGLVFSFVLSGLISDRYGRKVIIVVTPLVVAVVGLIKSFSVNYWMLIALEFLETALGYGNASMILSLESVSQNSRVIFSCISDMLSCFGGAFFGLIAWKVPYWRHLIRAIYAPLLVVVFYIFLVDEGVRWLLAHNKIDEAVRVLNKVAKTNNITLSSNAQRMLNKISQENHNIEKLGDNTNTETPKLLSVLRSKTIALRVCLVAACFFCCFFVYNGVIINATHLSGNMYLNYSSMLIVSIPTRMITAMTLNKFGRRTPICFAYILCAVFFISSAFIPKSIWMASLIFYLAGKMCSSYGTFAVCVVAMEVFPTTSRNSLTNIAVTVGKIGTVIAPQMPLLEQYMHELPTVVFGVASLVPALLALLLPETSRVALPDHLAAAEILPVAEHTTHIKPPV